MRLDVSKLMSRDSHSSHPIILKQAFSVGSYIGREHDFTKCSMFKYLGWELLEKWVSLVLNLLFKFMYTSPAFYFGRQMEIKIHNPNIGWLLSVSNWLAETQKGELLPTLHVTILSYLPQFLPTQLNNK